MKLSSLLALLALAAILPLHAAPDSPARPAAVEPPSSKLPWQTDYEKALAEAKAGNKLLLMDFTGSDWCPWCIRLDKDIFAQKAFAEYAAKNLVLLKLDFPRGRTLPPAEQAQNEKLAKQYNIEGFPTVILLDGEGRQVGEPLGYMDGGAAAFIAAIEKQRKSAP